MNPSKRPSWAPDSIRIRGVECHFEGTAPITGDAVYGGQTESEIAVHGIVTNPGARERQRMMFNHA